MKELLQYIFSSGWYFVGTVVLIYVVGENVADIVKAFRKRIECECKKSESAEGVSVTRPE